MSKFECIMVRAIMLTIAIALSAMFGIRCMTMPEGPVMTSWDAKMEEVRELDAACTDFIVAYLTDYYAN